MTIHQVSEFPATAPEQIEHFAQLLRRSENKRRVFREIYRGKAKHPKTAKEIAGRLGLETKQVLNIAGPLAAHTLFEQTRHNKRTAYRKRPNINAVKAKILSLVAEFSGGRWQDDATLLVLAVGR